MAASVSDVPPGRYKVTWLVNYFQTKPLLSDALEGERALKRFQAATITPLTILGGTHPARADCTCDLCTHVPYVDTGLDTINGPKLVHGVTRFCPAGNPFRWPHQPTAADPQYPVYALDVNYDVWVTFKGDKRKRPSALLRNRMTCDWNKVKEWLGEEGYGGWQTLEAEIILPESFGQEMNVHFYAWRRNPAWGSGWRFGGVKMERQTDA